MVFKSDTEFYAQLANASEPANANTSTEEPIDNSGIETLIASELFIVIIVFALYKFIANKKNRSEQQSKSKKDDSHNTGKNDNEQEYQQRQSHKEQSGSKEDTNQEQRNFEEILGLSDGWTKSDLKAAYRQKCQQLHPDKWGGFPKNIALTMEKEYKEVQDAYKHLSS